MREIERFSLNEHGFLVRDKQGTLVFFDEVEKFYTKRKERKKKEDDWEDCGIMSHLARDW
jgi:hypothetical protein